MRDEDKIKGELRKTPDELEKMVEERTSELSRSIARLEKEIYVRRMAEEELLRSRERFRSLVETTNDWVWEVDENAVYTYASPQVKDLLGYEPEEVLGKTPFDFMSTDEAKRIGEIFSSIAAVKKPFKSLENANLHKDGHQVIIETSGVPCFEVNGRFCGYRGIDRDITERKRAADALLQSNNLLNALSRAQFQFISDTSPRIIFDELLGNLLSLTKSEYGFIGEVFYNDSGEPYLKTHAITNIAWNEETRAFYEKNAPTGMEFCNLKSLFGEVMTTGKPVISNNPPTDPRRCGIPEGHPPLKAFLGLPFYKGERMVGMVGIANRPEGYDEKMAEYLAPFLATCGGIIDAYRNGQGRKEAEEALRKSEESLADAQRMAHLGNWEWDIIKDELYWSDEVYRIFGLPPQSFGATYEAFLESVHPDDRETVKKYVNEALYKKSHYGIDHRIILPDGMERIVHEQAEVIYDENGKSIRMIGTVQDITESKRVEEEAQRSYHIQTVINALLNISLKNISLGEQLDMIIEQIVSIFWLTLESKGGIFLVDDSGILLLKAHRGFTEEQKTLCSRVPSGKCLCGRALSSGKIEFADSIDDRHENLYEGVAPHGHYCVPIMSGEKTLGVLVLYLKEGHRRNVNEEEHLRGIANILAGIVQKKRAEEELDKMEAQFLQAQKMEAIGQLAGGVAHDFNNLMTVVQGNTDLALMTIDEGEPVYRNLKEIGRVTAKAAALTRQLLTFSRRQPVSKEILNVNKAVLEMSRMLQRLIGENIFLSTELSPDLWNTEADPGQVEQLLMNLVVNARDAMPNGGKLLIKTANARIDETYRQIYGEGRPGRFVQISVEDTGTGMDAETRAHIFEPFFTTKGIGKGTGLGLSVVYGIVKGHDGWINVYSEPGSGSNFRIYLPSASGGIEEKGEEAKSFEISGGNERILLVEDEKDVKELALLILERQGYKVFGTSTFDEAVSIFKKEGGRLDLLLSDIMLTDRSGLELAKELRRERPDLKVLFASGYSGEHFQVQADHNYGFLEKPYTLMELLSAVRDVLDERK